jgi:acetyl esterase/lipase
MNRLHMFAVWALIHVSFAAVPASSVEPEREVSYLASGVHEFDRSYDLYRPGPQQTGKPGALVIFVHSRFWGERQPARLIEHSLVPGLLEAGHTVAILRHRLLPAGAHPAAIKDVAQGVAALIERATSGEFGGSRIFLAGHSSGAQLALLVALDPQWLKAEGQSAISLAGVVSISGILDLAPGRSGSAEEEAIYEAAFPGGDDRRAASPTRHAGSARPSILLLTAARDIPGYRNSAVSLAETLRESGQPPAEAFIANGRDHFSILELADPRNDVRRHILEYLASDPRGGRLPDSWRVLATWRNPPYGTEDFHLRFPDLIETFPADERFNLAANRPFLTRPGARRRFTVREYKSIDLQALLDALGPKRIGQGDWLEMRNVRGEWAVLSRSDLRKFAPRLVVGVDTEQNLFRATDLYHTNRRYSWVDTEAVRVDMARPLGAFVYFPGDEPSAEMGNRLLGRYALTSDSFRLREEDPRARLSDLPPLVRSALTATPGCISCHAFRSIGGRALHLRADDGSRMGGHALPLERYPPIVWKRFIFDQARVAEEVGASPIEFEPELAQALFDWVAREKIDRGIDSWTHPERERE